MSLNSLGLFLTIKDIMLVVAVIMFLAEVSAIVVCLDLFEGYKITANNVFAYIIMIINISVYILSMSYLQSL